jgi:aminoglycoside 6'-N-acetyltransferase I
MTAQKYIVRPLAEADLSEWFRLRNLLWDRLEEEEHKVEMLDIYEHPESQLVLVAEADGGGLIGFLEASVRPFVEDCDTDNVGYLEGWFVEEEYRRKGVGSRLVAEAEAWARASGCSEMASDSEVGNDLSLTAHQNLGYRVTSRLIHLKKDLF